MGTKDKIKKACERLTELGFDFEVYPEHKVLRLRITDGLLGDGELRGWQWQKFRDVLVKNELDYLITGFDYSHFHLVIIPLDDSLNY